MVFSITVVSTATRRTLSPSMAPDLCPARIVRVRSHSTPSAPNPPTRARPRGRVDRRPVPEKGLAGAALIIRVLDPAGDHRLVRQLAGVLLTEQPRRQSRRCRRPPLEGRKEPGPFPLEHVPVNRCRQLHRRVPPVDHVDQTRAQQVILFQRARAMLHGRTEIAGFRWKSCETLQAMARKTATFQRKINGMGVVQGEPSRDIASDLSTKQSNIRSF